MLTRSCFFLFLISVIPQVSMERARLWVSVLVQNLTLCDFFVTLFVSFSSCAKEVISPTTTALVESQSMESKLEHRWFFQISVQQLCLLTDLVPLPFRNTENSTMKTFLFLIQARESCPWPTQDPTRTVVR